MFRFLNEHCRRSKFIFAPLSMLTQRTEHLYCTLHSTLQLGCSLVPSSRRTKIYIRSISLAPISSGVSGTGGEHFLCLDPRPLSPRAAGTLQHDSRPLGCGTSSSELDRTQVSWSDTSIISESSFQTSAHHESNIPTSLPGIITACREESAKITYLLFGLS